MCFACVSYPQYKVLLYSLDGRLLSTYSAYEWSLGVKSVTWSPSSQFLAIGSYDEKVWTKQMTADDNEKKYSAYHLIADTTQLPQRRSSHM